MSKTSSDSGASSESGASSDSESGSGTSSIDGVLRETGEIRCNTVDTSVVQVACADSDDKVFAKRTRMHVSLSPSSDNTMKWLSKFEIPGGCEDGYALILRICTRRPL